MVFLESLAFVAAIPPCIQAVVHGKRRAAEGRPNAVVKSQTHAHGVSGSTKHTINTAHTLTISHSVAVSGGTYHKLDHDVTINVDFGVVLVLMMVFMLLAILILRTV
jgi:hypothetical protein